MLQQWISNIITCMLLSIPLARINRPGRYSEWMRSMNEADRENINRHSHSLNPINWAKRPCRQYYTVLELQEQVVQGQHQSRRRHVRFSPNLVKTCIFIFVRFICELSYWFLWEIIIKPIKQSYDILFSES